MAPGLRSCFPRALRAKARTQARDGSVTGLSCKRTSWMAGNVRPGSARTDGPHATVRPRRPLITRRDSMKFQYLAGIAALGAAAAGPALAQTRTIAIDGSSTVFPV